MVIVDVIVIVLIMLIKGIFICSIFVIIVNKLYVGLFIDFMCKLELIMLG